MLQDRVPLNGWRKAVDRVCERAAGLIALCLSAGPACSLFVAAYRIDGSQGELSWLAVEVSRTSVKLGMP